MIEPIAAAGTSATWQTRMAAMQQQLTQSLFQAADTNGDGKISKSEFESVYCKFTGASTPAQVAAQSAAADQIFQQYDTQGAGQLNATQFAAALKQILAQQPGGSHRLSSASAAAHSAGQPAASSAALHGGLFSIASVPPHAAAPHNAGSLEFTA